MHVDDYFLLGAAYELRQPIAVMDMNDSGTAHELQGVQLLNPYSRGSESIVQYDSLVEALLNNQLHLSRFDAAQRFAEVPWLTFKGNHYNALVRMNSQTAITRREKCEEGNDNSRAKRTDTQYLESCSHETTSTETSDDQLTNDEKFLQELGALCIDVSHDGDCGVEALMLCCGEITLGNNQLTSKQWNPSRDENSRVISFRREIVKNIPENVLSKPSMKNAKVWVNNEFLSAAANWASKPVIVIEDKNGPQCGRRVMIYRHTGDVTPKYDLVSRQDALHQYGIHDALWLYDKPGIHFQAVISKTGEQERARNGKYRLKRTKEGEFNRKLIEEAVGRQRSGTGFCQHDSGVFTVPSSQSESSWDFYPTEFRGTCALSEMLKRTGEESVEGENLPAKLASQCEDEKDFASALVNIESCAYSVDNGLSEVTNVHAIVYLLLHLLTIGGKAVLFLKDEESIVREPVVVSGNNGVCPCESTKSRPGTSPSIDEIGVPAMTDPFHRTLCVKALEENLLPTTPFLMVFFDPDLKLWRLCTLEKVNQAS